MSNRGARHDKSRWIEAVRTLLAEGIGDAIKREQTAFDSLAAAGVDTVLFGAGGLGRKTLLGLRAVGREPLAFSDNNSQLWDTSVEGIPVLSPEVAALRYGRRATFVLTVWARLVLVCYAVSQHRTPKEQP